MIAITIGLRRWFVSGPDVGYFIDKLESFIGFIGISQFEDGILEHYDSKESCDITLHNNEAKECH